MEDEALSSSPWPIFYACPNCNEEVEAIAGSEAAQFVTCRSCGVPFVVASEDGATDLPEYDQERQAREQELDELRIRQISRARRAAIRARSYVMVGLMSCVVGAADLLCRAAWTYHTRDAAAVAFLYALGGLGLAWLTYPLLCRSRELAREIETSALPEPTTPPDLSTLSDGSELKNTLARNLEQLQ